MDTEVLTDTKPLVDKVVAQICHIILGKETAIRLSLACLLARGHLLIEDLPGVGKTTLAHALAKTLGLQFSRIQFTSDLLPADILGVSVFDQSTTSFAFHQGPIFAQMVLADEVNRATPKTQSALLEAMEERQVSVEGETRALPEPFFVIATQNPTYQIGTFPLPESQLDRFLMRIELGYPQPEAERRLLSGIDRRRYIDEIEPIISQMQLSRLQDSVDTVFVSEPILDYLQNILLTSRQAEDGSAGLSPRAGLAILRAARAWALMEGRDHVLPDDVQLVLPTVISHRLRTLDSKNNEENMINKLLSLNVP